MQEESRQEGHNENGHRRVHQHHHLVELTGPDGGSRKKACLGGQINQLTAIVEKSEAREDTAQTN